MLKKENKIDRNNTGRWGETKRQIRETERDRERGGGRRREREMLKVRRVVGLWLEELILCYSTITKE